MRAVFGEYWVGVSLLLVYIGLLANSTLVLALGVLVFGAGGLARLWARLSLEEVEYRRELSETRAFRWRDDRDDHPPLEREVHPRPMGGGAGANPSGDAGGERARPLLRAAPPERPLPHRLAPAARAAPVDAATGNDGTRLLPDWAGAPALRRPVRLFREPARLRAAGRHRRLPANVRAARPRVRERAPLRRAGRRPPHLRGPAAGDRRPRLHRGRPAEARGTGRPPPASVASSRGCTSPRARNR